MRGLGGSLAGGFDSLDGDGSLAGGDGSSGIGIGALLEIGLTISSLFLSIAEMLWDRDALGIGWSFAGDGRVRRVTSVGLGALGGPEDDNIGTGWGGRSLGGGGGGLLVTDELTESDIRGGKVGESSAICCRNWSRNETRCSVHCNKILYSIIINTHRLYTTLFTTHFT